MLNLTLARPAHEDPALRAGFGDHKKEAAAVAKATRLFQRLHEPRIEF